MTYGSWKTAPAFRSDERIFGCGRLCILPLLIATAYMAFAYVSTTPLQGLEANKLHQPSVLEEHQMAKHLQQWGTEIDALIEHHQKISQLQENLGDLEFGPTLSDSGKTTVNNWCEYFYFYVWP